jgi:alpha-N-arabinofuranosidase
MPVPLEWEHEVVRFKVRGDGRWYNFYVSFGESPWLPVAEKVDASNLSTESAGGFVGVMLGPYAGPVG